jgi:hypothetical protein
VLLVVLLHRQVQRRKRAHRGVKEFLVPLVQVALRAVRVQRGAHDGERLYDFRGVALPVHVHTGVQRSLLAEQRFFDVGDARLERLHHLRLFALDVFPRRAHRLQKPVARFVQVI